MNELYSLYSYVRMNHIYRINSMVNQYQEGKLGKKGRIYIFSHLSAITIQQFSFFTSCQFLIRQEDKLPT